MVQQNRDLYQLFGLAPGASRAQLKIAYKRKAASLHPDKNPHQDTTEQFKSLQNAYHQLIQRLDNNTEIDRSSLAVSETRIISTPSNTQESIALNRTRLTNTYQSEQNGTPGHQLGQGSLINQASDANEYSAEKTTRPLKPPCCERCGIINSDLRLRKIESLTGLLLTHHHQEHCSVLCSRCGLKQALKANLHNTLLGWWSPTSLIQNPGAIWSNMLGGICPTEQNAILLYRMANHELQTNRNTTALALLFSAQKITTDASLQSRIERMLSRLGNPSPEVAINLPSQRRFFVIGHVLVLLIPLLLVIILLLIQQTTPPTPSMAINNSNGLAVVIDSQHRQLYPESRLGDHYTLGLVNLYQQPTLSSRVLQRLPIYSSVKAVSSKPDGWLEVRVGNKSGFTREAEIGFGDARIAKNNNCNNYPSPRPFDGEVLSGKTGNNALTLSNEEPNDALLTFKAGSESVLRLYIHSNSTLEFKRLPANITAIDVKYGRFFNESCGIFTENQTQKTYRLTLLGSNQSITL